MKAEISIVFAFCIAVTIAYPTEYGFEGIKESSLNEEGDPHNFESHYRAKRQWNLQGGGGGSPRQGFDISVNSRFPIWQSQNGINSLHGNAGYAQHLGGPYGNSPPNYSGGLTFTHRF